MLKATSYSQNSMFEKCPRQWYYSYVKKLPAVQDLTYANAGKVIHEVIEKYLDCCTGIIEDQAIKESLSILENLESLEKIDELMACYKLP